MNKYKYIVFNPHLQNIESVINTLGESTIWLLSHIVPYNGWCSIAVFECWDGNADENVKLSKSSNL